MRSALLGGVAGAVVSAAVLLGAGALDDDPEPAATAVPPAATQAQTTPEAKTPPGAAAEGAEGTIGRIYEQAAPATVSILVGNGGGTGFLTNAEGEIVTNAHVVGDAKTVTVRFGPDGARLRGTVLGSDPGSDLALVRIPAARVPEGARPLELADSDDVEVGDLAVAIGNPFGLPRTATAGIVSAVGRTIRAPNQFSIPGAIQTDAAINPGNSGGPLLDEQARVIGVNSQIETTGGGNVGVGFAVPSNTVREVVPDLEDDGRVRRAYLGVSTGEPRSGTGALVAEVVPGAPAARAGVRAGDVIVGIGEDEVDTSEDVTLHVSTRRAGDEVEVRVRRDGRERTFRVELGEQPRRAAAVG